MSHIPFKKHQIDELYIPVIPLNSISTYNLSIWCFYGFVSGIFFWDFLLDQYVKKTHEENSIGPRFFFRKSTTNGHFPLCKRLPEGNVGFIITLW